MNQTQKNSSNSLLSPDVLCDLAKSARHQGMKELNIEGKDLKIRMVFHQKHGEYETLSPTVTTQTQESAQTQSSPNHREITSPLVGVVYVAPSPDAEPFIREGSMVKEGDVLFIIEAMKVMNQVKAPCDGVIQRIDVENEKPVEYGQLLASLTP